MDPIEIMKLPAAYASGYENTPVEAGNRAKQLCWEYNQTAPCEQEKRYAILQKLFGTCASMIRIEPDFHCDYGFNIHTHGFVFINYNCVILDTSPVNIGAGAFIAPGVCLACSGHAFDPEQRSRGSPSICRRSAPKSEFWAAACPITISRIWEKFNCRGVVALSRAAASEKPRPVASSMISLG